MSPVAGSDSFGKYQSAVTVLPPTSSVERRTVTLLPGGRTGGPAARLVTSASTLKTRLPTALIPFVIPDVRVGGVVAPAAAATTVVEPGDCWAVGSATGVCTGTAPAAVNTVDASCAGVSATPASALSGVFF